MIVAAEKRGSAETPSRLEWVLFVFVLLVQQNSFLSIPILTKDLSMAEMRAFDNVYNTAAVGLSILVTAWLCTNRLHIVVCAIRTNIWQVLFVCLALLSASWSIHPDITIRRGVAYAATIVISALLPLRFGHTGCMKVLSAAFTISAIGSLAFVAMFPKYGIMGIDDLQGCWQGVFCTKELLGSVMAVAIFVELYLLVAHSGKQQWRFCLLAAYVALLLLSRSMTALLTSSGYVAGACVYLLWRRSRTHCVLAAMLIAMLVAVGAVAMWSEPKAVLGAIGKDTTLTGRVGLWPVVLRLVEEKPLLGRGYRAMWQPDDLTTRSVDDAVGWAVPSAHNTFLEIALELGCTGVFVMVGVICVAVRAALWCCSHGSALLGWFSAMLAVGIVVAGQTGETLGRSQVIEWLVFSSLAISCGLQRRSRGALAG
jgi:exopolysaccharide production protein ExoQ